MSNLETTGGLSLDDVADFDFDFESPNEKPKPTNKKDVSYKSEEAITPGKPSTAKVMGKMDDLSDIDFEDSFDDSPSPGRIGEVKKNNKLKEFLKSTKGVDTSSLLDDEDDLVDLDLFDEDEQDKIINNLREDEELSPSEVMFSQVKERLENDEDFSALIEAYNEGGLDALVKLLQDNDIIENDGSTSYRSQIDVMSNEDLLIYDIETKCPDCSQDEIEEEFYKIRNIASKKYLDGLRRHYKQQEVTQIEREKEVELHNYYQELEQQKNYIIESISALPQIGVFKNNESIQKSILPDILEPGEDQEHSRFMYDLYNDPVKQYQAAFWVKYQEDVISHFKKEIEEAYKKGKRSVFEGLPTKPKHKTTVLPKSQEKSQRGISLDDLD